MRIEQTGGGKGAGGGAADAGIAVHDERCVAVPTAHEVQHLLDMGIRRRNKAIDLFGDVVHRHFQVIGREHRCRPLHLIDVGHDRQDVAGAGGFDSIGKCGERADVNHGVPFVASIIGPAAGW